MSKSRSRKPFQDYAPQSPRSVKNPRLPRTEGGSLSIHADESSPGVFGFFREMGTRETVESLLVAIILALMFRAFLAEAFIIPTGSMAPSLMGRHKEVSCENSGFRYEVGVIEPDFNVAGDAGFGRMPATYCPITQHRNPLRRNDPDHQTNSGDRILVNKFIYDFKEPDRYDAIVFKYPNNAKQNYIKRLVGLPGENILIENGDIYLMNQQPDGTWEKEITRKPPSKLLNTMQIVDDTHHIGKSLKTAGWPYRWNQYRGDACWDLIEVGNHPTYESKTGAKGWLRYRHFRPNKRDWDEIELGRLPERYRQRLPAGRIIADTYSYNDTGSDADDGMHWVGDIGMEIEIEIKSAEGQLLLDAVEGGAHFTCRIDVSTGQATLACDHPNVKFVNGEQLLDSPQAQTPINKPGKYRLLYFNADDRIHLWVDNQLIRFDAPEYLRDDIPVPQYSAADAGDAEPLGVGVENLHAKVTRLKVVRDLYYVSAKGPLRNKADNESGLNARLIESIHINPEIWSQPESIEYFMAQKGTQVPMFQLKTGVERSQDQFLPLGDNSPRSLDGRIWDGPNYVERELLIGRATFVYWPHALNKPIPFFPNFKKMRFIR